LSSPSYALGAVGPQDNMPSQNDIKAMLSAQASTLQFIPATPNRTKIQFAGDDADTTTADTKVSTLKNGMKIVTAQRPGSLSCGAWVGAGSDHETPELNGATHMNEHMMFKGTPS